MPNIFSFRLSLLGIRVAVDLMAYYRQLGEAHYLLVSLSFFKWGTSFDIGKKKNV